MKRIKKFYNEHRVFTILMSIVIVCMIVIATVLFQCFYVGNSKDKYGNRLEGIENVRISDDRLSEFESKLITEKIVKGASIKVTGKIIYIDMSFEENVDLVEAESIALKSLENFSEEEQAYYDFNFTLKQDKTATSDGFLISGAKNNNGNGLIWNNNRIVTTTEKVAE